VHRHLSGGESQLDRADREDLDQLITDVGHKLQGPFGAGIFSEQQESIAEMMVNPDGKVLSHYDFRRRLLELPGWEQFTALFMFFLSEDNNLVIPEGDKRVRFIAKVPYKVHATTEALARLETRLTEIYDEEALPRTAMAGHQ
jgi:hypothetical protein